MLEQVKEFTLHYWMRNQVVVLPEPYPELGHPSPAPFLHELSWCAPPDVEFAGSGELQRSYKLRENGQVGEFSTKDRTAIIDLRELETKYEWIRIESPVFDFNVHVALAGSDLPSLVLPLLELQGRRCFDAWHEQAISAPDAEGCRPASLARHRS
jgi:hypothetical protein